MFWAPGEAAIQQYAQDVYRNQCDSAQMPPINQQYLQQPMQSPHHSNPSCQQEQYATQVSYQQQQQQYPERLGMFPHHPQSPYARQQHAPAVWSSSTPAIHLQRPLHQIGTTRNEDRARNCIEEFNEYFGNNPLALWALQKLCRVAGVSPPENLQACRTALQKIHMNIFDVVEEGGRFGRVRRTFDSRKAMLVYSWEQGKMWPKRLSPFQANRLLCQLMEGFS